MDVCVVPVLLRRQPAQSPLSSPTHAGPTVTLRAASRYRLLPLEFDDEKSALLGTLEATYLRTFSLNAADSPGTVELRIELAAEFEKSVASRVTVNPLQAAALGGH